MPQSPLLLKNPSKKRKGVTKPNLKRNEQFDESFSGNQWNIFHRNHQPDEQQQRSTKASSDSNLAETTRGHMRFSVIDTKMGGGRLSSKKMSVTSEKMDEATRRSLKQSKTEAISVTVRDPIFRLVDEFLSFDFFR